MQEKKTVSEIQMSLSYDLENPEKVYSLPNELDEISGISYYNQNRLACVQDEKATIYIFDLITEKVERKISFGKDGDFEGVEIIGTTAWALKSNGNLYQVKNFDNKHELKVEKYETALNKKNDAEGLAYDKANNRLLIACKGHSQIGDKKGKGKKAIFGFDLKEKKLSKTPVILIDLDSIKEQLELGKMSQWGIDLLSVFDESKGDLTFQPSGIAVHPVSNEYYIVASVGKLLIVLGRDFEILSITKLDKRFFKQPEGICFDESGTLFISNEGKGSKATILKFSK